jgi:hypothetical protein
MENKKHVAGLTALKYNKMQDMQYTEKSKICFMLHGNEAE